MDEVHRKLEALDRRIASMRAKNALVQKILALDPSNKPVHKKPTAKFRQQSSFTDKDLLRHIAASRLVLEDMTGSHSRLQLTNNSKPVNYNQLVENISKGRYIHSPGTVYDTYEYARLFNKPALQIFKINSYDNFIKTLHQIVKTGRATQPLTAVVPSHAVQSFGFTR